jgi:hypothetical protein
MLCKLDPGPGGETIMRLTSYADTVTAREKAMKLSIGPLSIWFSYGTPIAYQDSRTDPKPIVMEVYDKSGTTQKHAAWIDSGNPRAIHNRLNPRDFQSFLCEALRDILITDQLDDDGQLITAKEIIEHDRAINKPVMIQGRPYSKDDGKRLSDTMEGCGY